MMKKSIAHIQTSPVMAGAQQVSYDILKGLDDNIYDKFVIVGSAHLNEVDNAFFNLFKSAGIKIIVLPNLKREIGIHDLSVIFELYSIFKKYKFDIVHTNSTKPAIVGRIAAKLARIKKIVHTVHGISFHSSEKFHKKALYYCIEFLSTLFGDYNITVNRFYLKYYKYLSKKRCFNIYNGVDFSTLSKVKKSNNSLCKILFMGRLDSQKDPLTFLKAINHLVTQSDCTNFEVLIGGLGDLEKECKDYVKAKSLDKYITFLGWVTDKNSIYNQCDVLCVPSVFEAFGLVFVEAAFFRIPVVSTNVEGIPEVVLDNKTGFLVPKKDFVGIATKLALLINNPKLRTELGENGYRHVTSNFSVEKMVTQYNLIYTK